MKIQIKARFTGSVLFEHEEDGNTLSITLQAAFKARANLAGAYLAGAYLAGANLARANLVGANLVGAYLAGANLAGANLDGAYLAGANLDGANLDGANLAGANLDGANLYGTRPVFQVGPIGSRCSYLVSFITTVGIKIKAGCFFGSRDEFAAKVEEEHGDSIHGEEYRAALVLIDAHAKLWGKAEAAAEVAQVEEALS
jgi:uncharacterized protein YjbI with pentapeptide repeats